MVHYKIDGVSALSNIKVSKEGIRAWRAYDVGPGRLIPQKFDVPSGGLPSIISRNELVKEVTRELAPKHLIAYDMYNLCEVSLQKKLSEFLSQC